MMFDCRTVGYCLITCSCFVSAGGCDEAARVPSDAWYSVGCMSTDRTCSADDQNSEDRYSLARCVNPIMRSSAASAFCSVVRSTRRSGVASFMILFPRERHCTYRRHRRPCRNNCHSTSMREKSRGRHLSKSLSGVMKDSPAPRSRLWPNGPRAVR